MTRNIPKTIGWLLTIFCCLPGCKLLSPCVVCPPDVPLTNVEKPKEVVKRPNKLPDWQGQSITTALEKEKFDNSSWTEVPKTPDIATKPLESASPYNATLVASNLPNDKDLILPSSSSGRTVRQPYYPAFAKNVDPLELRKPCLEGGSPEILQPEKQTEIKPTESETKIVIQREPIVVAMEKFLQEQPEEAIQYLQAYEKSNQEFFLRLLPVLAQMTNAKIEELDDQQTQALYLQLESLLETLRAKAHLMIDTMCYCSSIESYGMYSPLGTDHAFRAGSTNGPGELVQIYVQLKNLCPAKCEKGFQTKLSSSIRINDNAGNEVWFYNFKNRQNPLQSQSPRRDHFNNYSFYVPHIPAGTYTLTIEIEDQTNPGANRIVRKSMPFRVQQ